jgi:hypothetical protein
MKKTAIIFGIIFLNAMNLYSQLVEKEIEDKVILKCLEKLFTAKHSLSKKGVISISDNEPTALGERVLVISNFLVDREDIDSNIGQVIGVFKGNIVVYKTFKEKRSRKSAVEVEKMRDSLDDYLLGNKSAYIVDEKKQEEGFTGENGTHIKFDKRKSKRVAYVKGFQTKVVVKANGIMEISHF